MSGRTCGEHLVDVFECGGLQGVRTEHHHHVLHGGYHWLRAEAKERDLDDDLPDPPELRAEEGGGRRAGGRREGDREGGTEG